MRTESDVVFNVVWTGSVFRFLRYFVASQMDHSEARFRFVNNGCDAAALDAMRQFAASRPDRVVEVLDVSPDTMGRHGDILDAVRRIRDDGPYFALIDADILATGPFVTDFLQTLAHSGTCGVSSGRGVWADTDTVPEDHPGVNGEYFRTQSGFLFGSPHFAIYERGSLEETAGRWQLGFGSGGRTLSDEASGRLRAAGLEYLVYDTGKLINAFLQFDGGTFVHVEHTNLMHVGGVSHYLAPTGFVTTGDDAADVPDWSQWRGMETRFAVAEFTATVLRELDAGRPAPPVPEGLEDPVAERLLPVRDALIQLVEHYRPVVQEVGP